MKKLIKEIVSSIVIIAVLALFVFIGLIIIPGRVTEFKTAISATGPVEYSQMTTERRDLLFEFDEFVLESSTAGPKKLPQLVFSNPFKLNWTIQKDIYNEVEAYHEETLKLWYVYNMGVIVKVEDETMCFDLSTVVTSPNLLKLASTCDYLFISHGDGDHFSPSVASKVLDSGGSVFINDASGEPERIISELGSETTRENVHDVADQEQLRIDGMTVLGVKTRHRMQNDKDNTWFLVQIGDYKIAHTGDGVLDNYQQDDLFNQVDVLFANVMVVPLSLNDIGARYVIPVHMHELGHGEDFLQENSFRAYFDELDQFEGTIEPQIYPLLWGESLKIMK